MTETVCLLNVQVNKKSLNDLRLSFTETEMEALRSEGSGGVVQAIWKKVTS